jgi:hypothetical protein
MCSRAVSHSGPQLDANCVALSSSLFARRMQLRGCIVFKQDLAGTATSSFSMALVMLGTFKNRAKQRDMIEGVD